MNIDESKVQHIFPTIVGDDANRQRPALCGKPGDPLPLTDTPVCVKCFAAMLRVIASKEFRVVGERNIDADHAVALERERIAAFLNERGEDRLIASRNPRSGENVRALLHEAGVALNVAADAIRNGAHNATSGPGTVLRRDNSASGSPSKPLDFSWRQEGVQR